MRRFRKFAAILLLAVGCLGQSASLMMNPNVKRVGMKLACLCGVCKNSIGDCVMMGCHYAGSGRQKIAQMQSIGANDENIVGKFIEEQGLKALVVPPASGFNLTAWVMPFLMMALGLYAIYVYVQKLKRPLEASATPSAKYDDLAQKELDRID